MTEFIKEFIGDLKDLLFTILLIIVAETIVLGPIYFLCWIFGGVK